MSGPWTTGRIAAACAVSIALAGQPAHAQPSSEAEALNDEGKRLFKEQRYLEAYKRFQQATSISPEGKYFFNLCFSLNYLERFQEAIDACEQVEPNGADPKLIEKTEAVLEALRAKVPEPAPLDPDPNTVDPNDPDTGLDPGNPDPNDPNAGPSDPNAADPNAPNTAVGTGPAQVPGLDPFAVQKQATGAYAWSLGASAGPIANLGLGTGEVQDGFYAGGALRVNMFANFMYNEAQKIGLQGYVGYASLGAAEPEIADPLTMVDLGAAAYKHFTLTPALNLTPLAGVHVSLMQPESDFDEALLALGLRAQVALDWGFGASKEHVVSVAPSLNLYSRASDGNALSASDYGLDGGGASFEISVGYQYRFTTPFGSGPLFELE